MSFLMKKYVGTKTVFTVTNFQKEKNPQDQFYKASLSITYHIVKFIIKKATQL